MKVIEVKEYEPRHGGEYLAANYPGDGIYYVPRMGSYYVVREEIVSMICLPAGLGVVHKDLPEPTLEAIADPVRPASDTVEVIRALNLPLMFAAAMHKEAAVSLADAESLKGGAQ